MIAAVSTVDTRAIWYATRGTGTVSFLLLTAVAVMGVANVARWAPGGTPRFVVQRVHRDLSLLALVFIGVHVLTAVLDGFAPIHWIDAVVPFGSPYRTVWLGLGTLAFDLAVAVVITSLLRARLGYLAWRVTHWLAYSMWVLVVVHAMGVGTDARQAWMIALVAASIAAMVAAVIWRVLSGWSGWEPARAMLVAGTVLVPPALALWILFGPLAAGWAVRAGTPANLLASSSKARPAPTPQAIVLPDQAAFSGSVRIVQGEGVAATLAANVRTSSENPLSVAIVLDGDEGGGGFEVRSGTVRLVPPEGAAIYRGRVTGLDDGVLRARLSDGFGDVIDLQIQLSILDGQAQGQLAIGGVAAAVGA